MVDKLRKGFKSGKTREKSYRIQQLKNLFKMLEEREDQILEAGYNDLRKVNSKNCLKYTCTYSNIWSQEGFGIVYCSLAFGNSEIKSV